MFYKRSFLIVSCGLFLTMQVSGAVPGRESVTLLESSIDRCEFTVEPAGFSLDTVYANGKIYIRPHYTGAVVSGNPFDPAIPETRILIGLPPKSGYQISVIPGDVREYSGVRVCPIAGFERKDEILIEKIEEGPVYSSSDPFPEILYQAEDPSIFGDQRAASIFIRPVQYFPREDRLLVYSHFTVQVLFDNPSPGDPSVRRSSAESRYQTAILNYETARHWRLSRKTVLRKPVSPAYSGTMYTLPITNTGVYKITGQWLSGQGVDISQIDVSTLKMYNNGGRELSRNVEDPKIDGLREIAVYLSDGGDGSFDSADYLLFYGVSVNDWEYDTDDNAFHHYFNIYTTQNIYWLAFNDQLPGKRMAVVPFQSVQGATVVTSFTDHQFIEQDIVNPYGMNRYWAGESISSSNPTKTVSFTAVDAAEGGAAYICWQIAASSYIISKNNTSITFNSIAPSSLSAAHRTVGLISGTFNNALVSGANQASVNFSGVDATNDQLWLDWVEFAYPRLLTLEKSYLRFFSPDSSGAYAYPLEGAIQNSLCFDVSDPANARQMVLGNIMGKYGFFDSRSSAPQTYAVISPDAALTPGSLSETTFKNLRDPSLGADFVIITHDDFYDEAVRLKEHKIQFDSLKIEVVNVQDIYNNFSGGLMDPVAIRDFLAAADSLWQPSPAYVLLFGDGDFDYKNILAQNDKNWMPPFGDCFSDKVSTLEGVTDDFFVMIKGANSSNDKQMDLAVGRIPVRSASEAKIVVDKIIQYESDPAFGDWRMRILMVADDENHEGINSSELGHSRASEQISQVFPESARIDRLYLFEYEMEAVGSFRIKPKAKEDLIRRINEGALIVNYIGHSSEEVWADERIFEQFEDLPRLENNVMLPLFFSASCSFGLYDHYAKQSFSEDLLAAQGKGAIAVISASRACHSINNEPLNKRFMTSLFKNSKPTMRIGDALLVSKISGNSDNALYQVFGDPTMRLGFPRYQAVVTSVEPDTFKALSVVRVKGEVQQNDEIDTDFSGTISLDTYDAIKNKLYRLITQRNTQFDTSTVTYQNPGNLIFRGEAKINNGQFDVPFIVPKDISYNTLTGRINGYFWNSSMDGSTNKSDIPIGGSVTSTDQEGPAIRIYFDGREDFITGDMVPENPVFIGEIEDPESGVNITGEIGHKIVLTLNDSSGIDITEQFQYDEGSYQKGKVRAALDNLSPGDYQATLKVWDNANNSSSQAVQFQVVPDEALHFDRVMNWPNPFSKETYFTFVLNQQAEITVKIFTISGRLIQKLDGLYAEPGFNKIKWNGRDWAGDLLANGVYLYKIEAKTHNGEKTVKSNIIERLMVLHE